MVVSAVLALFFGGFAFGSLHTARQEYRWRNATAVRGVLVKSGSDYHYEYRPKDAAAVAGPRLSDQSSDKPDGVIDDWVRLDYDPNLPEHLRRRFTKGRVSSNYEQSLITGGAGLLFSVLVLACVWSFLKATYAKFQ